MQALTVIRLGASLMGLAVILGAFGAHALKERVDPYLLEVWHTGVTYHAWHALGLLLIGVLMSTQSVTKAPLSAWLMVAGIAIFSGSLYAMTLTGVRWLGAITPIGGLCFIAAWALLAMRLVK